MVAEVVLEAMKKHGITHADNVTVTTEEQQDDDKVAQDPDTGGGKDTQDFSFRESLSEASLEKKSIQVLPIEDRDIFRGGMTAQRSLEMVIKDPQRFISGNWGPSSFVEMGPGGFEPASFMRQPESLMQLGTRKGRKTADDVLQAFRRQGASSLLEIGPGGIEPESFVQTRQKQSSVA